MLGDNNLLDKCFITPRKIHRIDEISILLCCKHCTKFQWVWVAFPPSSPWPMEMCIVHPLIVMLSIFLRHCLGIQAQPPLEDIV